MVYGAGGRQVRQVAFQAFNQHRPIGIAPARTKAALAPLLEISRIDAVGIDQTTEKKAHQQAPLLLNRHRAAVSLVATPDQCEPLLEFGCNAGVCQQVTAALQ